MKKFNGKAIYNPSGKAGEYSSWACNFYVGCSNGCTYCYCKQGILVGVMGQDKPQLKKCFKDETHAYKIFCDEIRKNLHDLRKSGLFFSFTTDPMLTETKGLTEMAMDICLIYKVPVKVLTKCTEWTKDFPFDKYEGVEKEVAFGFTLTGNDQLEPGAATNAERIKAMKFLHDKGFKTFASIEPIIDFESSAKMIEQTSGFCDLYKIGLMSGKKYDKKEAQWFWTKINLSLSCTGDSKVYWKDSFLKLIGVTRETTNDNFRSTVDRDYNIFEWKEVECQK